MTIPAAVMFDGSDFPAPRPGEQRLVMSPGQDTPMADLARATAHDLQTARDNNGHVQRHLETALTAASPDFDFDHADTHADSMISHLDSLIEKLKRLHPAVCDEICLLADAMRQGSVADASPAALPRTCAHLLITSRVAAAHVRRHLSEAMAATTPESVKFNTQHALGHVLQVHEHLNKLAAALKRYSPAVGREIDRLEQATWTPSVNPEPVHPPAGRSAPADYDVTEVLRTRGQPEPA
jgi:hypothetical protein